MTNPILLMLTERLLWPVPRVRWEVARSLARLIREEDNEAASALLDWIRARRLESEVVLGLGIIDAFDLGGYFEFAEVNKSVRAPSLLSDFILKRNFANTNSLSPMRYLSSPPKRATLPNHEEAWFDRYRTVAVPPIYSTIMEWLQQSTGAPFMQKWKHEWCWLQATAPRPKVRHPHFLSGGRRNHVGQVDYGQREVFVSAYLRMLGYAVIRGLPYDIVEHYALLALTMNRGLADLEPIERPDWAWNLISCEGGRTRELAQKLWASAEAASKPSETLLALRAIDCDRDGFVEFDMTLAIGPSGFSVGPAEAEALDMLMAPERPSEIVGSVGPRAGENHLSFEHPLIMTQLAEPEALGRVHIDIVLQIRLASPIIFGTPASIQCGPSEIRLEAGTEVLSRWIHWYSDWEPAQFRDLGSAVNSMTTVLESSLDRLRASYGMEVARLVRVRRLARSETHGEDDVRTESFWM